MKTKITLIGLALLCAGVTGAQMYENEKTELDEETRLALALSQQQPIPIQQTPAGAFTPLLRAPNGEYLIPFDGPSVLNYIERLQKLYAENSQRVGPADSTQFTEIAKQLFEEALLQRRFSLGLLMQALLEQLGLEPNEDLIQFFWKLCIEVLEIRADHSIHARLRKSSVSLQKKLDVMLKIIMHTQVNQMISASEYQGTTQKMQQVLQRLKALKKELSEQRHALVGKQINVLIDYVEKTIPPEQIKPDQTPTATSLAQLLLHPAPVQEQPSSARNLEENAGNQFDEDLQAEDDQLQLAIQRSLQETHRQPTQERGEGLSEEEQPIDPDTKRETPEPDENEQRLERQRQQLRQPQRYPPLDIDPSGSNQPNRVSSYNAERLELLGSRGPSPVENEPPYPHPIPFGVNEVQAAIDMLQLELRQKPWPWDDSDNERILMAVENVFFLSGLRDVSLLNALLFTQAMILQLSNSAPASVHQEGALLAALFRCVLVMSGYSEKKNGRNAPLLRAYQQAIETLGKGAQTAWLKRRLDLTFYWLLFRLDCKQLVQPQMDRILRHLAGLQLLLEQQEHYTAVADQIDQLQQDIQYLNSFFTDPVRTLLKAAQQMQSQESDTALDRMVKFNTILKHLLGDNVTPERIATDFSQLVVTHLGAESTDWTVLMAVRAQLAHVSMPCRIGLLCWLKAQLEQRGTTIALESFAAMESWTTQRMIVEWICLLEAFFPTGMPTGMPAYIHQDRSGWAQRVLVCLAIALQLEKDKCTLKEIIQWWEELKMLQSYDDNPQSEISVQRRAWIAFILSQLRAMQPQQTVTFTAQEDPWERKATTLNSLLESDFQEGLTPETIQANFPAYFIEAFEVEEAIDWRVIMTLRQGLPALEEFRCCQGGLLYWLCRELKTRSGFNLTVPATNVILQMSRDEFSAIWLRILGGFFLSGLPEWMGDYLTARTDQRTERIFLCLAIALEANGWKILECQREWWEAQKRLYLEGTAPHKWIEQIIEALDEMQRSAQTIAIAGGNQPFNHTQSDPDNGPDTGGSGGIALEIRGARGIARDSL